MFVCNNGLFPVFFLLIPLITFQTLLLVGRISSSFHSCELYLLTSARVICVDVNYWCNLWLYSFKIEISGNLLLHWYWLDGLVVMLRMVWFKHPLLPAIASWFVYRLVNI